MPESALTWHRRGGSHHPEQEVTDADNKLRREAARAATLAESPLASQLASAQVELERVRSAAAEGAAAHAAALQALQALQGEVEVRGGSVACVSYM
jgi:hypothetical protein